MSVLWACVVAEQSDDPDSGGRDDRHEGAVVSGLVPGAQACPLAGGYFVDVGSGDGGRGIGSGANNGWAAAVGQAAREDA